MPKKIEACVTPTDFKNLEIGNLVFGESIEEIEKSVMNEANKESEQKSNVYFFDIGTSIIIILILIF